MKIATLALALLSIPAVAAADPACALDGKSFTPAYAVSYRGDDPGEIAIAVMEVAPATPAQKKDACDYSGTPPFAKDKRTVSVYVSAKTKQVTTVVAHPSASDNEMYGSIAGTLAQNKLHVTASFRGSACALDLAVQACPAK